MEQLTLITAPEAVTGGEFAPHPLDSVQVLDRAIDGKLASVSGLLAKSLLEVGVMLNEMQTSKSYQALGFPRWESYLKSKRQYGRTYLSYLLKLGKAGDLSRALKMGLGGTQLIEYAKATDLPEKIQQFVDATWDSVKDAPTRDLQARLRQYVGDHFEEYKKAPPGPMPWPGSPGGSAAGRSSTPSSRRTSARPSWLSCGSFWRTSTARRGEASPVNSLPESVITT